MALVLNHPNETLSMKSKTAKKWEEPLSHTHKTHSYVPEKNLSQIYRNILDIYLLVRALPWPSYLSSLLLYLPPSHWSLYSNHTGLPFAPPTCHLITCPGPLPSLFLCMDITLHISTWGLLLITPVSDQMSTFQKISGTYKYMKLSEVHSLLKCFLMHFQVHTTRLTIVWFLTHPRYWSIHDSIYLIGFFCSNVMTIHDLKITYIHSWFSLFVAVMLWKVTTHTKLASTETLLQEEM